MPRNLHSFRCQDELWDALQAHADAHGIGVNALLEGIASDYLGIPYGDSSGDIKPIAALIAEAISPLIARIETLEQAIAANSHQPATSPPPASPTAPTLAKLGHKPESPSQQGSRQLLTMGEAHREAQRRGFTGSLGTFRRRIYAGDRPAGVLSDFQEREKYPKKSKAARWLSFEP